MRKLSLFLLVLLLVFCPYCLFSEDYYLASEIDPELERLEQILQKQQQDAQMLQKQLEELQKQLETASESYSQLNQRKNQEILTGCVITGTVMLATGIIAGININKNN